MSPLTTTLIADVLLKATLGLGLAALLALALRRASAATRHLVWTLGVADRAAAARAARDRAALGAASAACRRLPDRRPHRVAAGASRRPLRSPRDPIVAVRPP